MSKYRNLLIGATAATLVATTPAFAEKFGLGRPALDEEVAAWDLDVAPNGAGLPAGSGNVWDGEEIFAEACAVCHGDFAEGVDNWPKLAGGADTLDHEDPLKTVGSYWPHVSTVWDYVNRSMPFGNAQSLTPDEVYAIVAYILYSNDLVDDDFVLSSDNLTEVELPNAEGFIIDDRAETEYSKFTVANACYENCKDSVEVTMRAMVLDVTPEETKAKRVQELVDATKPDPNRHDAAAAADEEAPAAVEVAAVAIDADLAAEGEKVFKKCKACHQVGDSAKNRTGPVLNGVVGRAVGAVDGFKYSKVMAGHGGVWDTETLTGYLANPRSYMKGTKMSFAGLKKDGDITAVIEYLKTFEN